MTEADAIAEVKWRRRLDKESPYANRNFAPFAVRNEDGSWSVKSQWVGEE